MKANIFRQKRTGGRSVTAGFSLLEVLIAVLVLSVGLLGIAALQAASLKNNQAALQRSQGVINSYSVLDAMRTNVEKARAGEYDMAKTCTIPAAGGDKVAQDKRTWLTMLQNNLGSDACGTVACSGALCTVTVEWNDSRGSGKDGEVAQKFETKVRL